MELAMNVEQLIIQGNSKVVFGHVTVSFEAKEKNMRKYSALVKHLMTKFTATLF